MAADRQQRPWGRCRDTAGRLWRTAACARSCSGRPV